MKVILLQDVARLGRRHDIKDVPDGLARNYLIPRKMVLPATPDNIEKAKHILARRIAQKEEVFDSFRKTAAALENANLTLHAPANPSGGLFRGIRAEDIAALIAKEVGPITADQIDLDQPIKTLGKHTIQLASSGGYTGSVTITVMPE